MSRASKQFYGTTERISERALDLCTNVVFAWARHPRLDVGKVAKRKIIYRHAR